MFNAAQTALLRGFETLELAVYLLVSMTAGGLQETLILAGNGAGVGAAKIARGMFESALMAEYLRRNPSEVDDYIEFGRVLMWKRVQQFPDKFTPEQRTEVENDYVRIKPRFTKNGKVRNQWNRNSIRFMAAAIGREQQYDLPYSIAASMHHGNYEAMVAHIKSGENMLAVEELPSLKWVMQALVSSHTYLLQALETLNVCMQLDFDRRIEDAGMRFQRAWHSASSTV